MEIDAIHITLAGKDRRLILDLNALERIDLTLDRNTMKDGIGEWSYRTTKVVLWSALLRDEPDLTIDEVGAMVTTRNFNEVTAQLMRTYMRSMPEPDEGADAPLETPAPARAERRRRSKSSGSTSGRQAGTTPASPN